MTNMNCENELSISRDACTNSPSPLWGEGRGEGETETDQDSLIMLSSDLMWNLPRV